MKSLLPDTSLNNVKAILHQQFSLVPTETHATTCLMHRYQQKGEGLQEFNFEFSELTQTVSNGEVKDITNPLHKSVISFENLHLCAKVIYSSYLSKNIWTHASNLPQSFRLCTED